MKKPDLTYRWPDGHSCAFCFTIDVDAESPHIWRSRATGIKALQQIEQRRYGLREGIWNLLDLLQNYGVKATCFVPGYEVETRPWLLESLAERGHEVALHGYYHEVSADITTERFRETLEKAMDLFKKQIGVIPRGYRSPSWEMTPESFGVLRDLGLEYDSSLSGYDHPYEIMGLVEMPIQWPLDDAMYFRFFGGGVDRWLSHGTGETAGEWLEYCDAICGHGGVSISTMHPYLSGRTTRLATPEALLRHFSEKGVWMPTLSELNDYHRSSSNKGKFVASAEIPVLPETY